MKKLIIPILLLSIVTTSCRKDKTPTIEADEIDTLTYFPFEKILGIYSGELEEEESSYYKATDYPDPVTPYHHIDTVNVSIDVVRTGLKTIAFLPDNQFEPHPITAVDYRNHYTIDSLVPSFLMQFSVGNYHYNLSARFGGEELDSLYINTFSGWNNSNDAEESYTYIYKRFRLKKD